MAINIKKKRICTFTAGSMGLIPGQGTKILHAMSTAKKTKQRKLLSI